MNLRDAHGHPLSGATGPALEAYERALAIVLDWRAGPEGPLEQALQLAPQFVMAHALRAWLLISGRDPARARTARPVLELAARWSATAHERAHLAAAGAALADDFERAKTLLGQLLKERPRDALALHVAHGLDYVTGDRARLRDRVAAVLPSWSAAMPGYPAVLAMHAFGLGESGRYRRAERTALAILALQPHLPRAHHAMAHVFEMTGRATEGAQWLNTHVDAWRRDSAVATHVSWHLALFELALGRVDRALALYDQRIRAGQSPAIADLIDAAALLWRIELQGGAAGPRWQELAAAWAPHVDDRYCSFSDLHAMLAFVGARDWPLADRLEHELVDAQLKATRHGETTRLLGLPAGRALIAYGRGRVARAVGLLATLSRAAHRLGGSQAQRDVLQLTLRHALHRVGRPGSPPRGALPAIVPA
jgi:hypothetical protein